MKKITLTGGLLTAAIIFGAGALSAQAYAQAANSPVIVAQIGINRPPISPPDVPKAKSAETPTSSNVVVKPGENLSMIGEAHATTPTRLFDANTQIKDPNFIYPGDTIRIPAANEQLPSRVVVPVAVQTSQRPAVAAARPGVGTIDGGVWDRLAQCESGGNWAINTGNGFYGGLQFTAATWHAVGGSGLPNQASKAEQIMRGQILQARSGWGQWPACAAKLGLL